MLKTLNVNKRILIQEATQAPQAVQPSDRAFNTTIGTLAGGTTAAAAIGSTNLDARNDRTDELKKAQNTFEEEHPDNSIFKVNKNTPEITPEMTNQATNEAKDDVVSRWNHTGNSFTGAGTQTPEDYQNFQNDLASEKLNALVHKGTNFSIGNNPDYISPPSYSDMELDTIDPALALGGVGAGALAGGALLYKGTPMIEKGINKIVGR